MPGADDPYEVMYAKLGQETDVVPGQEFLRGVPKPVRARMFAVLIEVAKAPPHRFAGGGYWEAMHGKMAGWYEVRIDFQRRHYRLCCLLEGPRQGHKQAVLAIVCGLSKPFGTIFRESEYQGVRLLGDQFRRSHPRLYA
jgi:hypothetical protein